MTSYAGATEPQQLSHLFSEYMNAGDVDGLMSLYEDEAVLWAPGSMLENPRPLRETFERLVAAGARVRPFETKVITCGDLALSHGDFQIDIDGQKPMMLQTAEVARRQADGTWKCVIDNAFGTAIFG